MARGINEPLVSSNVGAHRLSPLPMLPQETMSAVRNARAALGFSHDRIAKDFLQKEYRAGMEKIDNRLSEKLHTIEDVGSRLLEHINSLHENIFAADIREKEIYHKEVLAKLDETRKKQDAAKNMSSEAYYTDPKIMNWGYELEWRKKGKRHIVKDYYREDWEKFLELKKDHKKGQELEEQYKDQAKELEKQAAVAEAHLESFRSGSLAYLTRHFLSQVRPLGGTEDVGVIPQIERDKYYKRTAKWIRETRGEEGFLDWKNKKEERVRRSALRALEVFPTAWLEAARDERRRSGEKPIIVTTTSSLASAFGYESDGALGSDEKGNKRINWSPEGFERQMKDTGYRTDRTHSVIVHEMTHYMETMHPALGRAGNAYRALRAQEGDPFRLEYASHDYRKSIQKAMRKKEVQKHVEENPQLKSQLERAKSGAVSEVLSTAIESLLASGGYRYEELRADDRHQSFALGCLALL